MIRRAERADIPKVFEMIQELAHYEKEPDAVINTATQLEKDIFEDNICNVLLATEKNAIVGFALYYVSYSTWRGKSMYLEDLYIQKVHRRKGHGEQLFDALVAITKQKKYKRMDWQVLEWNEPAIEFYKKKEAELDPEWWNGRLYF